MVKIQNLKALLYLYVMEYVAHVCMHAHMRTHTK
jgi:hypothetical protein